jgi:cAMP-binding proteins - catabolite gene activator and regulatory subunit of cAMP-dependent protein kinases
LDESFVEESDNGEHGEHLPSLVDRPKRRASICAEKLCVDKIGTESVKKIPKTDEEISKIQDILKRCVLFEHLDEDQLNTVKDAMFPVVKGDEEIIIEQGQDGDNFYIIEQGMVEVYIASDSDQQRSLVASYNDGDFFGELAIMYNAPRAATCIAKGGPVKLWALDRASFKVILMKDAISKRNQYTSFLKEVPILSNLTEYEILTIADALHEESFHDGEVIFEQGGEGEKFYIVKEGSVLCKKTLDDGEAKEVAHLQSGGYFGEVALLTRNERQATVAASGPTKCLSLDRKTFRRVMKSLHFPSY